MIDMLQNAKDLIAKGKALNDPELIQMGMDLLEQYSPSNTKPEPKPTPVPPQYKCSNCDHTMPVDRENRKRCPECKKHTLKLVAQLVVKEKSPSSEELLQAFEQQTQGRQPVDIEQFHRQVRQINRGKQYHYDDDGNIDGTIRRSEAVDPNQIRNEWNADEYADIDRDDPQNEALKKVTRVSPRMRPSVKFRSVKCEYCGKVEQVHPIHADSRAQYVCEKCVRRRSRI